jgi:hypothetical protein
MFDMQRSYSAGHHGISEWNKQPMHPGVRVDLGSYRHDFPCPVCRAGDKLGLDIWSFADNTPGHVGFSDFPQPGLTESTSFALYQDATKVAGGPVPFGIFGSFAVTPAPAAYRLVVDTQREAPYFRLATKTHTEWTFRSSHADGHGRLPTGWTCFADVTDVKDCAVVPLMTARYDLPLSLTGRMPAGASSFGLTVQHLRGGPQSSVSSATVGVSYDDGAHWSPARTTNLGGGRFRVTYTPPAAGRTNGYVAIRLDVTDAAGGQLNQTMFRAYALS